MKQNVVLSLLLLVVVITACGTSDSGAVSLSSRTPNDALTSAASPTNTPILESSPYPNEGMGPTDFPSDVNPLTGLWVTNPSLLERRPIAIKVANIPRYYRPHWGLSLADIIFEYYTEEGSTRFIALFYGNNAEMVGPIRSARFFDGSVVRGYKSVFAFVGADAIVLNRLYDSEFAERLITEGNTPIFRYDPNGYNLAMVNTADLSAYMTSKGLDNRRQNLDGMYFQQQTPPAGQPVEHVFVRYSAAIYNRWDYDPVLGKYLRFSDTQDDLLGGQNEQYKQLTDRLTDQSIAFDNVVILFVTHEYYRQPPGEIIDILFTGSGTAYACRDGQVYEIKWQRNTPDAVVSLSNPDGTPFSLKPGTTWFEVVGQTSQIQQNEHGWRVTHRMP